MPECSGTANKKRRQRHEVHSNWRKRRNEQFKSKRTDSLPRMEKRKIISQVILHICRSLYGLRLFVAQKPGDDGFVQQKYGLTDAARFG